MAKVMLAGPTSLRRPPPLHALWAAVPLVIVIALKTMGEPLRAEDFWWHLGMGRVIADEHAIPMLDRFSFTRSGVPYFDQPWLAQLLLFEGHRIFGLAGLLEFDFVLMLAAEALAVAAARARGAGFRIALLVPFALAPVAARGWSLRPQALVVPIFAAFFYLLTRWRRGGKPPLWLLVPLMALWANLHGSFPVGIVLVLLMLVARAIDTRRDAAPVSWLVPLVVAAACALAPLANPRGTEIFAYVAEILRSPAMQQAREWQPVTISDLEGAFIWFVLLVVAALAVWKRAPRGDLVVLVPFALLDLSAVRNGIWLSLVMGPMLSSWLSAHSPEEPSEAPLSRRALAAPAIALLLLFAIPWLKPHFVPRPYGPLAWEPRTPIGAVAALAVDERRPSRLAHGMGAGSYLIFALPSQRVFLDPRIELYPRGQWDDFAALAGGNDIDAILTRYRIDGVLADKGRESPLVRAMQSRAGFELRFEDEAYAYFARR